MKGLQGIVIAVGLGLLAAACNWWYMVRQSSGYETESFLIVDPQTQINAGDKFKDEHFKKVDIPKQRVGDLLSTGILFKDKITILGQPATRSYTGGELVLRQDTKTLSRKTVEDMLSPGEIGFPVAVDPRTFVSDNFSPGDT